jgi:hypothetical protein
VQNAAVAFAVTLGNGSTDPRVAMTDSKGQASAAWTLGTILGPNQVSASVTGVDTPVRFDATGIPGPVASISISPSNARLLATVETLQLTATSLDAFGNATSPAPTFVVRDPTLISVDATGLVKALRRGVSTYVVVSAATKTDSVLVTVLDVGQSLCTAAATPVSLAVGQVVTDVSGQGFCVSASAPNGEYAIVPFYDSGVPSASVGIEVRGQGVTTLGLPRPTIFSTAPVTAASPSLIPDDAFESRLRERERTEMTPRAAAARAWYGARRNVAGAAKAAALSIPTVGDLLHLNANAADYCNNAVLRTGRVAAVTDKAIVVADTANPLGGFTDAEYRSIGVTFDTLVDPTDRAAFGAPSDIDTNGHVILFFTRAVNELTPSGATSAVLGFFYSRDLLPKTGAPGPCSGSNTSEMFYLMVPDTGGIVNGNRRSKATVVSVSNGTVAHEYQHLINASRRLYVNGVGANFEEKWLDEGLSHTAEELNFFRSANASPRTNLGSAIYSDPLVVAAYSTFEKNNFSRYAAYLSRTETQAPIGSDPSDDDLPTRGAIWNFLRFAADHLPAGQENPFWFKLVNANTTGMVSLTSALGGAPNGLLRDWAISVFADDYASSLDARYQQPSWNLRSALTNGGVSLSFPLVTRILSDNVPVSLTLAGNGVSFLRFSVPAGKEALLTATSGGQPLPSTVKLAVVRVR